MLCRVALVSIDVKWFILPPPITSSLTQLNDPDFTHWSNLGRVLCFRHISPVYICYTQSHTNQYTGRNISIYTRLVNMVHSWKQLSWNLLIEFCSLTENRFCPGTEDELMCRSMCKSIARWWTKNVKTTLFSSREEKKNITQNSPEHEIRNTNLFAFNTHFKVIS